MFKSTLTKITWLYLTLPFFLFCLGWLRLSVALPAVVLLLWALWNLFRAIPQAQSTAFSPFRAFIIPLLMVGLWVLLSGVGGYAFQNWDHHWRNAVFHDLITFDFPVIYAAPTKGPIQMLVYYVGYWLPAAWVGKFFGWQAANSFLFLWTWLGVFLVIVHLGWKLQTSLIKSLFLLVFFSGMDALGVLLFASDYPTLFPPIQHLEIWSGALQYSSFTTQLFWVFNQAVPAWLCSILILESDKVVLPVQDSGMLFQKGFAWSLSFFFSPLAALGLLPFFLLEILRHFSFRSLRKGLPFGLLFASVATVSLSLLYFSSNTAAQQRGFQSLPLSLFLSFFLLEGGALWLLLAGIKGRDRSWLLTGLLLALIPFIQLGTGRDFVMRASIAPLFNLMLLTGEALFHKKLSHSLMVLVLILLVIGSFTPLYEITRSIHRTAQYYLAQDASQATLPSPGVVIHLEQPGAPENEHPGFLVADEIQTLKFMNDQLSKNFVANVRQSFYYRYLSPH